MRTDIPIASLLEGPISGRVSRPRPTPRQRQMLEAVRTLPGHRGVRGSARLVWASLIKHGWIARLAPPSEGWGITIDGLFALEESEKSK